MAKKTQAAATEQNPPSGGRWIRLPDGSLVRPDQEADQQTSGASADVSTGQANETVTETEKE